MAGHHRIRYDEGDVYEGEWSSDGKRHGLGVLTFSNQVKYAGEFVNGFFQGYGLLTFPDGSKYEGVFEAGKYQGYGVYCSPDGIKYEVRVLYTFKSGIPLAYTHKLYHIFYSIKSSCVWIMI